jgi:hypothetical protein
MVVTLPTSINVLLPDTLVLPGVVRVLYLMNAMTFSAILMTVSENTLKKEVIT